jgi:hypothetical protein
VLISIKANQHSRIEVLLVIALYLIFDLLIPYTSPYALMMTTVCWILIPTLIAIRSSAGLRNRYVALIILLEISFIWLAGRFTREGNVSGDASEAVSFGAFIGIGPTSVNNYFTTILLANLLLAIFIVFLQTKISKTQNVVEQRKTINGIVLRPQSKALEVLLVFVLIFLTSPYFEGIVPNLRLLTTATDFDSQQIHAWYDYASRGFVPMKDFWFPYNGMIFLQDGLLGYFAIWFILILVGVSLYRFVLLNSNYPVSLSLLALIMVLSINYPVISVRYFFPFVALLLACLGMSQKRFSVIYFLPLAISLWMSPEIAVVVYLLFIIALAINFIHISNIDRSVKSTIKPLMLVTASLVSEAIYLATNKSLSNLVLFLSKPNETIQYGFSPLQGLRFEPSRDISQNFRVALFFVVILLFAVSTANVVRLLITKRPVTNEIYIFMAGCFSISLLQKELVRGGLTLWIAVLLVLSTVGILKLMTESNFDNSQKRIIAHSVLQIKTYVVVGVFLLIFSTPVLAGSFTQIARSPQQVKFLVKEFSNGNLGDIFLNSNWNSSNANLAKTLQATLGIETIKLIKNDFFILGDRPDIYRALSQKPYWLMSQYNMSPIREQKKIILEIENRNPSFLIVDKRAEALSFDGIASPVRLYAIYQFLTPKFQLYRSYDSFDLLIAKNNGLVDYEYWNGLLGSTIDLGSLPLAATKPRNCQLEKQECGDFLRIEPRLGQVQEVPVICGGRRYTLRFNSIPQGESGWISLNRLWFWDSKCSVILSSNVVEVKGLLGSYLY